MKPRSQEDDVIYIDVETSPKALKQSYESKKSLYGITKEQYLELLDAQGIACASCGDDATGAEHTLCIDHDHYTNEIRGLLCNGCNTALGWLEDDPIRAEKLAKYARSAGTGIIIPFTHAQN